LLPAINYTQAVNENPGLGVIAGVNDSFKLRKISANCHQILHVLNGILKGPLENPEVENLVSDFL
jgi:hypothetical protein